MTTHEVDDDVAVLLREADQRYTSSRRRLVAALQAGEGPLTIAQISEADRTLPQSTIYRNLSILEEAGAVTRVVTSDDFARYELTERLMGHHHHLICDQCGDIADFSLDAHAESALDSALDDAARVAGFHAGAHRLDLHGICSNCK